MKKLIIAMVTAGLLGVDVFAGDPGGSPGLAKAIFKGSVFDMTSDVSSHAIGYQLVPDEMYVSSLEEKKRPLRGRAICTWSLERLTTSRVDMMIL